MADTRNLGHALSAMNYIPDLEFDDSDLWSRYNFQDKFITLRITPKTGYSAFPTVVDVF